MESEIRELLIEELKDAYSAEKQALRCMQRAMKKAKATPAPATHPTPSSSPGKFNLGDLFKPRTSAAANPAAASPAAPHGAATKPANSPAPTCRPT